MLVDAGNVLSRVVDDCGLLAVDGELAACAGCRSLDELNLAGRVCLLSRHIPCLRVSNFLISGHCSLVQNDADKVIDLCDIAGDGDYVTELYRSGTAHEDIGRSVADDEAFLGGCHHLSSANLGQITLLESHSLGNGNRGHRAETVHLLLDGDFHILEGGSTLDDKLGLTCLGACILLSHDEHIHSTLTCIWSD